MRLVENDPAAHVQRLAGDVGGVVSRKEGFLRLYYIGENHFEKVYMTTIHQPKYELGQKAAEILLRRIQGDGSSITQLVLPTELVVRASTAPPHS
jgi:hypothetical protein